MTEPSSPRGEHKALYPEASERVNGFLSRFGDAVDTDFDALDETGFSELRYGDLAIGVTVNAERGLLLLLAPLMEVPKEAGADFFRRLLELNFVATGPCALALDADKPHVYLRGIRALQGLSYEEFEVLLQTLATVAVEMRERLRTP